MKDNMEQLAAANKATVDALLHVANTALTTAERLVSLNMSTARSVMEDSMTGAKAVMESKSLKDAASAAQHAAKPAMEKATNYTRAVYEISAESQKELSQVFETQFGEFQKNMTKVMEAAFKTTPFVSDEYVTNMQKAMDAANSAFGNMNTIAKKFTDAAKNNVATATEAMTSAGKK